MGYLHMLNLTWILCRRFELGRLGVIDCLTIGFNVRVCFDVNSSGVRL
jgi:hypothetical protein